jgi:hypothetical protein
LRNLSLGSSKVKPANAFPMWLLSELLAVAEDLARGSSTVSDGIRDFIVSRTRSRTPRNTLRTALQSSITGLVSKRAMASATRARQLRKNFIMRRIDVPASAEAIATELFGSISFNKSRLRLHDFQWLLAKSGSTEQQLSIFLALHDCPMTVSNGDLERILKLELCNKTSSFTAPGTHFYIHSLELTRYQLEQAMEFMAEQGVLFPKAAQEEITSNLHNNQAQPCTFTIRHVGKVPGPKRPIDHHIRDLATDKR